MSVTAMKAKSQNVSADPITTQVIKYGLNGAAEQMKIAVVRTAFSPIIYDAHDFACGIYDRNLRLLSQAETVPIFQGTLHLVIEGVLRALGGEENLSPGDVILTNYAYDTGTHANDVAVVMPGFLDGALVGYTVIKAHMMDVGGKSMVPVDTTDIWQEGLILPGVKLYDAGVRNESLFQILEINTRLPQDLLGDLNALVGACRLGLNALYPLMERYGVETFGAAVEHMWDHGEKHVRKRIAALKDGRWTTTGQIDEDGVSTDPIEYTVTVEVKGDSIHVDLTDMPPQATGPINVPFGSTLSSTRAAIMAVVSAGESANEGHFRPISIETKKGTIFDPITPAPVGIYGFICPQYMDLIFRALSNADPEAVAASGPELGALVVVGEDEGRFWGGACDLTGGQPAALKYGDGGAPLMHMEASGTRISSWEVWEGRYPMIIDHFEYDQNTGGVGEYRGSNGIKLRMKALEEMTLIPIFERTKTGMKGLFGGGDGASNLCKVTRPDGAESYHSKAVFDVPANTVIDIRMSGGGGVGDPSKRDPKAVHEDIQKGLISEEFAREHYGHAF